MGINRIRLQDGAMVDPRMQQTYQQNIAANQAQQARNEGIFQAARNRMRGMGSSTAQAQEPGILSQVGTAAKNLATIPGNFLKAFVGDVSNPGGLTEATLTQSQKDYLKQKALEKGGERGSLSYDDYGIKLKPTELITKSFTDPTALSTALTAGGVSYNIPKVGPQTGEPQFTGLTYDWDGALPFIDKGGVMGMASRGVEKVSDLLGPSTAMAAESSAMPQDDYYAQNESAIRSGMMPAQRPTMADVAGAVKTDPRAGIKEAFLSERMSGGPSRDQLFTSVVPDFDRYGTYTGDDQLIKDYAAAGRGTTQSQLVKLPANHPYAISGPGYYEYDGTNFSKTADLNMTPEYEKFIRSNYGLASGGRVGFQAGSTE